MTDKFSGVRGGEPEIIGTRCKDGGKCHHHCITRCARQHTLGCVPLGASGLEDDWSEPKIPTIYASIGDREDVNTRPSSRTAVEAALGEKYLDSEKQIAHLELALREALTPQFLADSLREWADDNLLFPASKDEVRKLAAMISPKSL